MDKEINPAKKKQRDRMTYARAHLKVSGKAKPQAHPGNQRVMKQCKPSNGSPWMG